MESSMEDTYVHNNSFDIKNHYYYFSDDILLEILYRLPPKSIFRFKCVSKRWLSLISDPSFLASYLSPSKDSPPSTLFFRFDNGPIHGIRVKPSGIHYITCNHFAFKSQNIPVPVISCSEQQSHTQQPPLKKFQVLASSEDLFLFASQGIYYVCNVFTDQWIELPTPPTPEREGLGFISRVEKGVTHYKVVVITHHSRPLPPFHARRGSGVFQLETFSSETGEWRNSNVSLPEPISLEMPFFGAVPYNGILHWIEHRLGIIIAYDPHNNPNKSRFIELPMGRENTKMGGINAVLGVCQGRLRYFETCNVFLRPQEFQSWNLWVLEDYDREEWRLEHRAERREICAIDDAHSDIHARQRVLNPIAFHPLNWDIIYFWCQGGYVVTFNLLTGCFDNEFYSLPNQEEWIFWWSAFPIVIPSRLMPAAQLPWKATTEEIGTERKEKKGKLKKFFEFSWLFK